MTIMTSEKWRDLLLPIVIFVAVIGLKLPALQTPYYWDEMGAYVEPSYWLSQHGLVNALPGFHPQDMFFGHPPVLYTLVALFFKLGGTSRSGPHLLTCVFAFLGCYFTYSLGKLLYGRHVGLASAAILFAMPLYFSQAGMVLGDIPVAALGAMTVFYYLSRCYPAFLLSGFCLVMVKETGMAIVVAVVVYQLLTDWKEKFKFRRALLLAMPLVPLAIFFAVQKVATGSLLPNPYFNANDFATFSPSSLLLKGGFTIYTVFFAQFRFLLILAIIAGIIVCRQEIFRPELLLFGFIAIFFIGTFAVIYFLPRYSIPLLPYLSITAAAALFSLCKNIKSAWMATTFCLLLFMLAMHGDSVLRKLMPGKSSRVVNFETNMDYLDVVWTYQQAGAYLERNFSHTPIFAPWPLSQAYNSPYLGYISRPLRMVPNPETAQVIVFSEQSKESELLLLDKIIKVNGLKPLQVYAKHGKSTSIYLLPRGGKAD